MSDWGWISQPDSEEPPLQKKSKRWNFWRWLLSARPHIDEEIKNTVGAILGVLYVVWSLVIGIALTFAYLWFIFWPISSIFLSLYWYYKANVEHRTWG